MAEMVKCAECGEIVELASLRAHISVEHLRWVPYECGNCYPVLTYKATEDLLRAHNDSIHPGCIFRTAVHCDPQLKLRLKQIKRRSLGLQGQENRSFKEESMVEQESDRGSVTPAAQLETNRSVLNESSQSATPVNEPINEERPVNRRLVAAELEAETSETSSEASAVETKEVPEELEDLLASTNSRVPKFEDSFDYDTAQTKEDSFAAEEAEKKPKRKQNLQAVCSPNDKAEAEVIVKSESEGDESDVEFARPIAVARRRRPAAPKNKKMTVPCNLCDQLVAEPDEHILCAHLESARFVCNRCPYKQTRKAVLLNHMAKKHPSSPEDYSDVTADLAEQFLKVKEQCFGNVKQEMKTEAEEGAETQEPQGEELESNLQDEDSTTQQPPHQKRRRLGLSQLLPPSSQKVECRQCGERRRSRDPDHVWRKHMQRPRFECAVCEKQYMRISQFRCDTHKTALVDYQYLLADEYQDQFQLCYGVC